jgi:uncharacterized protein YuzE
VTEERWRHIVHRQPEMEGERERVLETVADPDLIQQGDLGELLAIRRYPETTLTSKYVVVAYREVGRDDGFADVLYLSIGEPRPAVGVDVGEGVIVRYDESKKEVVGLTVIGLRARLLSRLGAAHNPPDSQS